MPTLNHSFSLSLDTPEAQRQRARRLGAFLRANGYVTDVASEPGDALDDATPVTYTRGKPGASWWSSNMTKLHSVITVSTKGNPERDVYMLQVMWKVDVTGQHLVAEDREFWRHEVDEAQAYTSADLPDVPIESDANPDALSAPPAPVDLRPREAERTGKGQASSIRAWMTWCVTSFLAVSILAIILVQLGLVSL